MRLKAKAKGNSWVMRTEKPNRFGPLSFGKAIKKLPPILLHLLVLSIAHGRQHLRRQLLRSEAVGCLSPEQHDLVQSAGLMLPKACCTRVDTDA